MAQGGHALAGVNQAFLHGEHLLLEIAPGTLVLANAVLVVEHLALSGVERVPQVKQILFLAVDGFAQTEQILFLVERLRLQAPVQLLQLSLQAALVVLQRVDALLQFGQQALRGVTQGKRLHRCGVHRVGFGRSGLVGWLAQHAGRNFELRLRREGLWRVLRQSERRRHARHHPHGAQIAGRLRLAGRRQQIGHETRRRHRRGRLFVPGVGFLVEGGRRLRVHGWLLVNLESVKSRLGFLVEYYVQARSDCGRVT